MRQQDKHLMQDFLSDRIRRFRVEQHLTQEKMAELLRVSPRSYADLEHGKYACSGLTVLMFLVQLDGERLLRLVRDFREQIERSDDHDAA